MQRVITNTLILFFVQIPTLTVTNTLLFNALVMSYLLRNVFLFTDVLKLQT